jgi:hypothetical protein
MTDRQHVNNAAGFIDFINGAIDMGLVSIQQLAE